MWKIIKWSVVAVTVAGLFYNSVKLNKCAGDVSRERESTIRIIVNGLGFGLIVVLFGLD